MGPLVGRQAEGGLPSKQNITLHIVNAYVREKGSTLANSLKSNMLYVGDTFYEKQHRTT